MTRTALLLVVLSIAVCSGQKVDLSKVSDAFIERVNTFTLPKLESRIEYRTFFRNLSRTISSFINDVVIEVYRQVRLQSWFVANTITSYQDELMFELQTNPNGSYVDELLVKMNVEFERYLKLKPGNLSIVEKQPPAIPGSAHIRTYVGYHKLHELFSNMDTIMDIHLSNINTVIDSFYKDGWKAARGTLKEMQDDFRHDYLNGYILQVYGNVAKTVFEQTNVVRPLVTEGTWKTFETFGKRIMHIYAEIKPEFDDPFLRRFRT